MTDAEHWNHEALTDPRYQRGWWGTLEDASDADEVTRGILAQIFPWVDPGDTAMEIGGGPGRLLIPLARAWPDNHFINIDHSHQMISIAAVRRQRENVPNISLFATGDLWFFDDASLNLIYSVEVFQHLPAEKVQRYLKEAYRILSPDGVFVFQWVVNNEPDAPYCYHHSEANVLAWTREAGFELAMNPYQAVHPEWRWVVLDKP